MSALLTITALLLAALTGTARADGGPEWAVAVLPSGSEVSLEIAADDAARVRGYMYREQVGPQEGMLFVFESSGHHSIWMKNCRVPLDIIWLDETFRVVEVAHEQPPCPDEGPCIPLMPLRTARYVLEVAGGAAREHGIDVGESIRVLSDLPLEP